MYPQRIYTADMEKPAKPLTPAVVHILLALSREDQHGYGIMKQVESDSDNGVSMGPGTLYGSLKRMLDAGLVTTSDKRIDPEMDDERRIYYAITDVGRKALATEVERHRRLVALVDTMDLLPRTCTDGT